MAHALRLDQFLLPLMGVLAPRSAHAIPSARAPIGMSGNFSGARVFRTTYKHLPQLLRTYISRHFSWYSRYFPTIRDTFLAFQSLFLAIPTLFPAFHTLVRVFHTLSLLSRHFFSFPDTIPINTDTFPFVFLDTFLDDLDTSPQTT